MSCYHPKKAFVLGINPDNGKKILKIKNYEVKYLIKYKNNSKLFDSYESLCRNALNCGEKLCDYKCDRFDPYPEGYGVEHYYHDFLVIPCGQCIGCRIGYSRQWAVRMMLEKEYSDNCYFLTLTYDDDHLTFEESFDPRTRITQAPNMVTHCDPDTGELLDHMTLNRGPKSDLVKFNKRLRKKFGDGIRFYATGEYGSKTFRPHYHGIYFNLPLEDLKFFMHDKKFNYYTSDTIARLWPFGFHLITEVSFETCAYVSRYVTKKATGEGAAEKYEKFGICPEYSIMSRRPGIGRQWFDEHGSDAYESYIITVSDSKGGFQFQPPAYYDRLFEVLDPLRMAEIKENKRKKATNINRLLLDNTDKDYLGMLEDEEFNFTHNPKNKYGLFSRKDL